MPKPSADRDAEHLELFFFFKRLFIFKRRKGREKERERNIDMVIASGTSPTGNLVCSLGMCPDQKSNQQPFGSQAGTPARVSTWNSYT